MVLLIIFIIQGRAIPPSAPPAIPINRQSKNKGQYHDTKVIDLTEHCLLQSITSLLGSIELQVP